MNAVNTISDTTRGLVRAMNWAAREPGFETTSVFMKCLTSHRRAH